MTNENRVELSPDQWAEYMRAMRDHNAGLLQAAQEAVQKQVDFIAGEFETNMRDRFAMCVLEGLLASGQELTGKGFEIHVAVKAYRFADAMLEARK